MHSLQQRCFLEDLICFFLWQPFFSYPTESICYHIIFSLLVLQGEGVWHQLINPAMLGGIEIGEKCEVGQGIIIHPDLKLPAQKACFEMVYSPFHSKKLKFSTVAIMFYYSQGLTAKCPRMVPTI